MSWNTQVWAASRAAPSGDSRYIMKPSNVISSCCLAEGRTGRGTVRVPPRFPRTIHLVTLLHLQPSPKEDMASHILPMWELSLEEQR